MIGPPATSRMPDSSFRISEHRDSPPPSPPSKRIHTAREPLPSMPDSQARTARSGGRAITGRAGAGAGGTETPACPSR